MSNRFQSLLLPLLGVLILAGAGLAPAEFLRPAEGPVPFRRDRLPLKVETMVELSGVLTSLAQGPVETAVERRSIAQRLALAVALDPANRQAREKLDRWATAAERLDPSDVSATQEQVSWCWKLFAWLDDLRAGRDARALAACLRDVLLSIDPDHPLAGEDQGETGAWAKWVPDLAAYAPQPSEKVEPLPPPPSATEAATGVSLQQTTLRTVLWSTTEEKDVALQVVPVQLEIAVSDGEKSGGLVMTLANTKDPGELKKTFADVVKLLTDRHPSLPAGTRAVLSVNGEADYLPIRNGSAISAVAAALMECAIVGNDADAVVLGEVKPDGSLSLPTAFWSKLRLLSKSPGGGRLVVPSEAAEWLPSVLALEDPEFFFKYEVLVAGTLSELVDRLHAPPAASYLELKQRSVAASSVPIFLADASVRQSLMDVAATSPHHASARMLVIQSMGNRPTRLPRPILAVELRRALEPVAKLGWEGGSTPLDVDALDRAFQLSRAEVAAMERHVEVRDRELHGRARDLALAVRTLARKGSGEAGANAAAAWKVFDEMRKSVLQELADEAAKPVSRAAADSSN
jgi:hypothetical protein